MGRVLSDDEVRAFHAAGYHFPVRAMDAATAESYRARIDAFLATQGGLKQVPFLLRGRGHLQFPLLLELVRHPVILDAVEDVLGRDLLCWGSSLFYKPARDPWYVSWHQDAYYWGLEPRDIVSAWVALSDSTPAGGAMQVLSHSHHGRMLRHRDRPLADNMLSRGEEIVEPIDPARVVTLALAAGEVSLHHGKLAHSSGANTTDRPRVGFAIRYVAAHVRPINVENDGAMLVRGADRFRNFTPAPSAEP